jgi:mono/diheme cytochrome c family protein
VSKRKLSIWGLLVCIAAAALFAMPDAPTATTQDGVYSEAQASSGKNTYGEKCSSCHLESLEGGVNESPALKGDEFVSHWDGKLLRALYSRILSTMPVNDPGTLSEPETLALVAYILKCNGFPAGKAELPNANDLNKIQFNSKQ